MPTSDLRQKPDNRVLRPFAHFEVLAAMLFPSHEEDMLRHKVYDVLRRENGLEPLKFGGATDDELRTALMNGLFRGSSVGGVLSVDGTVAATNSIDHGTPVTFPEDETFDVGLDTRTGVALMEYRYESPFRFTGKIDDLTFKLGPHATKPPAP